MDYAIFSVTESLQHAVDRNINLQLPSNRFNCVARIE